jgi:NAD(P)-dependent dehydrogenase (short-subunit alcohol dehydrogenase family)
VSLAFRHAIVVGASSGVGAEIARQLAAGGASVALLARREAELRTVAASIAAAGRGRALARVHDVRDTATVPALFAELVRELGGLDLVVYAAGIMHLPKEGEYDAGRDREQLEVNLLGAMAWTTPAVALFESRRAGTIVAISSIAGERGRRSFPAYSTSKAGLTAWMEALRNRASRYGVNVVTAKPGFVDTRVLDQVERKPGGALVTSPARAAELVLEAARRGSSASAFVPWFWWPIAFVLRHLPSFVFRRLNI